MEDQHLNLFYSYNRDNELIENNLTRAWIVTLRMLSAETKDKLLRILLDDKLQKSGRQPISFNDPSFALQGNIDKRILHTISKKFVVTIATERGLEDDKDFPNLDDVSTGESIPDAWIYDPDEGYCFLIEVKFGTNPLNADQVFSHAEGWLGITKDELHECLIPLTWHDVLHTIQSIDPETISQIENQLLQEFSAYLGFFGYRLFKGFDFSNLNDAPEFRLQVNQDIS